MNKTYWQRKVDLLDLIDVCAEEYQMMIPSDDTDCVCRITITPQGYNNLKTLAAMQTILQNTNVVDHRSCRLMTSYTPKGVVLSWARDKMSDEDIMYQVDITGLAAYDADDDTIRTVIDNSDPNDPVLWLTMTSHEEKVELWRIKVCQFSELETHYKR